MYGLREERVQIRAVGQRQRAMLAVLTPVAVACGIWLYLRWRLPWVFWTGDENEYAEIARRIARGEGFTTGILYPAELAWGAGPDHPSLMRAPVWPATLAALFALVGPLEHVVHLAVLGFYLATVAAAGRLGAILGGSWAGALAGIAVATSPQVQTYALLGGTEMIFAFWLTLAFLLLARTRDGVSVGTICGLAYLTRYNGIVVLPIALLLLAARPAPARNLVRCSVAFIAVALPWWIRNVLVAGNPFFTLYSFLLYFSPNDVRPHGNLLHMLEPDLRSPAAMSPIAKARGLLPYLLRYWPLASANPTACVGIALACVRGDHLSRAFALLALLTTVGLAFVLPLGRFFVPFIPLLLSLGVAAWVRHGGWLRLPVLAVLLLTPPCCLRSPTSFQIRKLFARCSPRCENPLKRDPWRQPWQPHRCAGALLRPVKADAW
jgi:4-amino-4-deoxy-L-arabinose transferase-like glycosyltransferase